MLPVLGKRKLEECVDSSDAKLECNDGRVKMSSVDETCTSVGSVDCSKEKIVKDSVESLPPPLPDSVKVPPYSVIFKRRNHNTLFREDAISTVRSIMPPAAVSDYLSPEVK